MRISLVWALEVSPRVKHFFRQKIKTDQTDCMDLQTDLNLCCMQLVLYAGYPLNVNSEKSCLLPQRGDLELFLLQMYVSSGPRL